MESHDRIGENRGGYLQRGGRKSTVCEEKVTQLRQPVCTGNAKTSELLAMEGWVAEVKVKGSKILKGIVYAIDPASGEHATFRLLILLGRASDPANLAMASAEKMKFQATCITLHGSDWIRGLRKVHKSNFDRICQYMEKISPSEKARLKLDRKSLDKKRMILMECFKKKRIPVVERAGDAGSGDVIIDVLDGSVIIQSPYGVQDCASSNPIMLARIKKMIETVEIEEDDT
eukprot:jgi/Bigna1/69471/fgenesh1_pg.9_\